MKNIIPLLLTVLILLAGNSYTKSQVDTTIYQDLTSEDVELALDLIPKLYKDVLRLDSCRSDADVLDSINGGLERIIWEQSISSDMQDSIIYGLNNHLDKYIVLVDSKTKQIKVVKKKAFWNGIKWGSGVTAAILIVILIL